MYRVFGVPVTSAICELEGTAAMVDPEGETVTPAEASVGASREVVVSGQAQIALLHRLAGARAGSVHRRRQRGR